MPETTQIDLGWVFIIGGFMLAVLFAFYVLGRFEDDYRE